MSTITNTGISRRRFLVAVTAGSTAAAARPVSAAFPLHPARGFRPGPAAPVRALHEGVPYFDFSGRVPEARAQKARPQKALGELTAEEQYLMGAW